MARRPKFKIIATPRHAIFFFAFFVLGAVMLALAKILNFDSVGMERFLIVAISIGLMGTYCFFVTIVPATRLRMDVAADNMYYLGFLYTLSSLAVALTQTNIAEDILSNFGVAIASTLIGIAARVSLNQLRVDPHDVEAASRLELSEATSRIRAELDETVFQLSSFRTMNLQVLAEGYEEVQKNIEETAAELFSSIETLLQKTAEPLDQLTKRASDANARIIETVTALNESNTDVTKSNRFMIGQIEKATNALQKLAEFYADTGVLNERVISSLSDEIERLQRQVTGEARDEFKKLSSAVKEASSAAIRMETSHDELRKDVQNNLKSFADDLGKASSTLENLEGKQADLTRETKDSLQVLQKDVQGNLKSVTESLGKASETVQRLDEKQAELANETKTELKGLKDDVQNSIAVSSKLEASVDGVSKNLNALKEIKTAEVKRQSQNYPQDQGISSEDAKDVIEAPPAKPKNGMSDPSASLSVFGTHNGYKIYRPESGEGYVAEGVTYGSLDDAKIALSLLPKAGS